MSSSEIDFPAFNETTRSISSKTKFNDTSLFIYFSNSIIRSLVSLKFCTSKLNWVVPFRAKMASKY
ncbi:hypothetical protein WKT22_02010 [Candidatus Lokiarchaeum ossiferum]